MPPAKIGSMRRMDTLSLSAAAMPNPMAMCRAMQASSKYLMGYRTMPTGVRAIILVMNGNEGLHDSSSPNPSRRMLAMNTRCDQMDLGAMKSIASNQAGT